MKSEIEPESTSRQIRHAWRLTVAVITVIASGNILLATWLPGMMHSAAEDAVRASSIQLVDGIKLIRKYYTDNVVAKVLKSGTLHPSTDHRNDPTAIPVPATFVQDLSDQMSTTDTTMSLVSPYPWANRRDRVMTPFQTDAWNAFQTNPDTVFSREDVVNGKRVLRVAVADRMTSQGCVDCHNSAAASPKHDWKLGDVRAVMDVGKVIEPTLAGVDIRARTIIGAVAWTSLWVCVFLLLVHRFAARRSAERAEAEARMRYLAYYDPMTDLLNRARFMDRVGALMPGLAGSGTSLAIHLVDLDHFKEINDLHGHSVGDEVVRMAALRLRQVARPGDLVGRLGGDEFVVAQLGKVTADSAQDFADKVVHRMHEPFNVAGRMLSLTASVGVIVAPDDLVPTDDLFKSADKALYHAKKLGRDRSILYSDALDRELSERRIVEDRLRDAVAHDDFELAYQPLCDAHTHAVTGFEALARLTTRDGVRIPPDQFIPIAEELGLIVELGAGILRRAAHFAAQLPEHLSIAVNLSPRQFYPDTSDMSLELVVARALAESGLAPQRLELEITEGLFLTNDRQVMSQLEALEGMGIRIALDDFGAGYAGFGYLTKFPFDKLKIDRSFLVEAVTENSQMKLILQAIAGLGRSLQLTVVAEGIETAELAQIAREIGCQQLQGYYFSRPIPQTDVAAYLLRRHREQTAELSDDRLRLSQAAGS